VALPTPFHEDFTVDMAALSEHARWLLANGCDGLVLFGTTGEAASLTVRERQLVLEQLVGEGLPAGALLVGAGCCAVGDTVDLVCGAGRVGAAGALILPPYYFRAVSQTGIGAYYDLVIEACGDEAPPIHLYNMPQNVGASVSPDLVGSLLQRHGARIRGYKDSSGDWANSEAILERFPGLHFYPGSEALLLKTLKAGGAGCISASGNLQPAALRQLFDGWRSPTSARLHWAASRVREILTSQPLIPAVKGVLAAVTGRPSWARLRPPLEPLPEKTIEGLKETLVSAGWTPPQR